MFEWEKPSAESLLDVSILHPNPSDHTDRSSQRVRRVVLADIPRGTVVHCWRLRVPSAAIHEETGTR